MFENEKVRNRGIPRNVIQQIRENKYAIFFCFVLSTARMAESLEYVCICVRE